MNYDEAVEVVTTALAEEAGAEAPEDVAIWRENAVVAIEALKRAGLIVVEASS